MIDKARALVPRHLPRIKKYALRIAAVVAFIGVVGFFALPPLVKSLLAEQLAKSLHRPVAIASVRFNPFALSLTIGGLSIEERAGGAVFASFDRLYANLESSSFIHAAPVFSEIRLENPKIHIVRLPDQRYNVSDLIDKFIAKPASNDPAPRFSLNNIALSGGAIEFDDQPLAKKHAISDINLRLPFVSNVGQAGESFVEPAFSARVNGAPLAIEGRSKPFADSRESELLIHVDDLQLAKYQDYLPLRLPIKIISGAFDGDLKFVLREDRKAPSALALSGNAVVTGMVVNEASGSPLISLKRLDVVLASADLLQRRVVVERIALDSPELHVRVGAQGVLNWQELLAQASADGTPEKPAIAKNTENTAGVTPVAPPVEWAIGAAQVNGGAMRWLDESGGKAVEASVEDFTLALRNLDSKGTGAADFDVSWRANAQDWLKVDAFAIKGGRVNLATHELVIGELAVRGTRMLVRRAADGGVEMLRPPTLRAVETVAGQEAPAPWKITLEKYRGEDLNVRFEDRAVSPAATQVISELKVDLDNVSTEPGHKTTLATRFKINGKGKVAVAGTVDLTPLTADLKLDLKGVELLPLQAYFAEQLNVEVTRGQLTVAGDLQVRQRAAGTATSASGGPGLAGAFSGTATIGDFAAIDKVNAADFLRWKSLHFGALDLRLNPDSLAIGDIALSDFFARAIISADGKLNLLQMVRHGDTSPPAVPPASVPEKPKAPSAGGQAVATVASPATPLPPISVGKITLQGGSVNFSDNFVKPNYSARLRQIGGRVSGLSSAAGSIADAELRGSYDNVAPLTLTARVNPFATKPFLDLQAEVKGIEMSSLSPYSGKYAGYAIEKGKLSLFVNYKLENNLLQAENRVFVDQLTFGEAVDSPDATKLPVTLAVALLKNRRGEIDINLPISGSLDDPQFSIGGLIWRVIGNLFVKAVSSPFALLGSLFGGEGGELSSVDFAPGRATIEPQAQERLEKLSRALVDRPGLRLEIEAHVDPEADREGAKRASIERKVRAQKREDQAQSGGEPRERGSREPVEVSVEEYPALLERVYRAEKFPKPRSVIGLVKSLPVAEMEKLILTNTVIADDDLRALAERRARVVRDWLLAHQVPGERVFLLPSKLAAAPSGGDEKKSASRVDFSLK